jgi:hypothetical protein
MARFIALLSCLLVVSASYTPPPFHLIPDLVITLHNNNRTLFAYNKTVNSNFSPDSFSNQQTCRQTPVFIRYKNTTSGSDIIKTNFMFTSTKPMDLQILSYSEHYLEKRNLSPETVSLSAANNLSQTIEVNYDCKNLYKDRSYDDVYVLANDKDKGNEIKLQFKVICHIERLKGFDISFLFLFGIAILVVFVAFHTPELKVIQDLSNEELKDTEFTTGQAVLMFFGASAMLLTLYLLMDYLMTILTIWVTCGCAVA